MPDPQGCMIFVLGEIGADKTSRSAISFTDCPLHTRWRLRRLRAPLPRYSLIAKLTDRPTYDPRAITQTPTDPADQNTLYFFITKRSLCRAWLARLLPRRRAQTILDPALVACAPHPTSLGNSASTRPPTTQSARGRDGDQSSARDGSYFGGRMEA
jgi:hypothetical protein